MAEFTPEGLLVDAALLRGRMGDQGLRKFLASLTVRAKPQPGAPAAALRALRTHRCYRAEGEALLLPRRYAPLLGLGVPAPPARPCRAVEPCELALPLYPYQALLVEILADQLRAPGAVAYLQADTGLGKTYVMLALAAALRVPTLVVVPTCALQTGGLRDAAALAPGLRAAAYTNAGAARRPVGPATHDVVFCVVNTAREKPADFFKGYGLVVLDEAHEYHSPASSALLWVAGAAERLLGLSATPRERPDGMDRVVEVFLGKATPAAELAPELLHSTAFEGHVREVWYEGDPLHLAPDFSAPSSAILTIGRVVADPCRLALVVAETCRLLTLHETAAPAELAYWGLGPDPLTGRMRRHSVFVFAEHREYLPRLRDALLAYVPAEEFAYDDGEDDGGGAGARGVVLRGGTTAAELEEANRTRVLLTTYGFSRRGISYKHMTAMVRASPRRHGSTQIVGRICRVAPDPALLSIRRVVVDIRDVATGLSSQAATRRKTYQAKGWPVYCVKCAYTDCASAADAAAALARLPERRVGGRAAEGAVDAEGAEGAVDAVGAAAARAEELIALL